MSTVTSVTVILTAPQNMQPLPLQLSRMSTPDLNVGDMLQKICLTKTADVTAPIGLDIGRTLTLTPTAGFTEQFLHGNPETGAVQALVGGLFRSPLSATAIAEIAPETIVVNP